MDTMTQPRRVTVMLSRPSPSPFAIPVAVAARDLALLAAPGWRPLVSDDGYDYADERARFELSILEGVAEGSDAIRWQEGTTIHLNVHTTDDAGDASVRCYTVSGEAYGELPPGWTEEL